MSGELATWVPGADDTGRRLDNLPVGVGIPPGAATARPLAAIGDYVIDLSVLARRGLLEAPPSALDGPDLKIFLARGPALWRSVRSQLQRLLSEDGGRRAVAGLLHPVGETTMTMPVAVGDYVDFFASEHHAKTVLQLGQPSPGPLHPSWYSLPAGYHGRASTLIAACPEVLRPYGQATGRDGQPELRPSQALDFELEVACVVGAGSAPGQQITTAHFDDHVFGLTLMNDWSARDFQRWESYPLGPFLSKSFRTSLCPWIVPLDALRPYRVPPPEGRRPDLPYLTCEPDWGFDIHLQVLIQSPAMRDAAMRPHVITQTNFRFMYWNPAQQLAHMTAGGAQIRPGDVYGSGTVSGPAAGSEGCMAEITRGGARPLTLPDGSTRTWLHDGDRVIIRGWCSAPDGRPLDLGVIDETIAGPGS